jgi:hypothetical protein
MTTKRIDPVAFFHGHAGWSHDPKVETSAQGRQRCARELAKAEEWARDVGMRFEWTEDRHPDRSGIEHDGTIWGCVAWLDDANVGSLWGIDLGAFGTPYTHAFARVIEAELAQEAMP